MTDKTDYQLLLGTVTKSGKTIIQPARHRTDKVERMLEMVRMITGIALVEDENCTQPNTRWFEYREGDFLLALCRLSGNNTLNGVPLVTERSGTSWYCVCCDHPIHDFTELEVVSRVMRRK